MGALGGGEGRRVLMILNGCDRFGGKLLLLEQQRDVDLGNV